MRIRILASGRRDLEEGFQFYESQDLGLGDYFLTSIKSDIEGLRITAGIHPIAHENFHRLLCKTFPFAIYYLKSSEEVVVYSVVDCRQDPLWIHSHLKESSEPIDPANPRPGRTSDS